MVTAPEPIPKPPNNWWTKRVRLFQAKLSPRLKTFYCGVSSQIDTMSSADSICIYCRKACKSSDSRPYPNLKSDKRIHNRCQIKKNLSDRKLSLKSDDSANLSPKNLAEPSNIGDSKPLDRIQERFAQEEKDLKSASSERKLKRLVGDKLPESSDSGNKISGQFFFDLKAGIAKPHEKRRYLHHKKLTDTASRFDDDGFKEEAIGRAYDHSGKDLNGLSDASDEDIEPQTKTRTNQRPIADKRRADDQPAGQQPRKKPIVKLDEKNPCWFCLSSDKLEKHLIIAIGQYCYLALAKGGLVDDHLMIMPIDHIMSISDQRANSAELLLELESFKDSLIDYFGQQSKGVVFFERNFKTVHWQLQAVPVPMNNIVLVETDIMSISKKYHNNTNYLSLPDGCPISEKVPNPQTAYFYWQIEPLGSRFLTLIDTKESSFPIQFGRLVLTDPSILNCPDRIDWKTCVKTTEEYTELVEEIKDAYRDFDISQ